MSRRRGIGAGWLYNEILDSGVSPQFAAALAQAYTRPYSPEEQVQPDPKWGVINARRAARHALRPTFWSRCGFALAMLGMLAGCVGFWFLCVWAILGK